VAQSELTRRRLLSTAAGGAAVLTARGLPAWAKPIAEAATGVRKPGSRPFPNHPAGTPSMPHIKHIIVLMMENHSFDNVLGMVPYRVPGRSGVDGLARHKGKVINFNRDAHGHKVPAHHAASPCQYDKVPSQSWNASHQSYNGGHNNGFVKASGQVAMWFWDQRDLPFTYAMARHFPIGNRYFSSVLAQTYPNRRYLFTGTSSGVIDTNLGETLSTPAQNGTIWDRFDAHKISYGNYYQQVPSWLIVPGVSAAPQRQQSQHHFSQFLTDAAAGKLPQFSLIDPDYNNTSEENPQDIQVGEEFIATVVNAVMKSPAWKNTALFVNFDEHGGYFDHVPPPRAIKPDSIKPKTKPGDAPGAFDRYGFRVPLFVVSPWAKPGYVSNVVQDHTSITAFIERKWNLPAMTFRDANAHPMTDYFNFKHAAFAKPPHLGHAPRLGPGLAKCHKAGLNPPLPGKAGDRSSVGQALEQLARRR
jgi:phospholipase C